MCVKVLHKTLLQYSNQSVPFVRPCAKIRIRGRHNDPHSYRPDQEQAIRKKE